jgi:hypothetical protein
MRKRTAAALIGVTLVLATGMSLLRQTQAVVAAKPEKAATDEVERKPSNETQRVVAADPEYRPDVEQTPADLGEHIRRTGLRSVPSAALPSPPLPSRVLPGPLPRSEKADPETQGQLLPTPPVPSKSPPGPIPEGAQNNTSAVDETEPIDPS